jgi:hypothetical protein
VAPEEIIKFVKKQFSKAPIKIKAKTIGTVLEIDEKVPYNVQYLCHKLWNRCLLTKEVKEDNVDAVLDNIIIEQAANYITVWDGLALHQRLLLKAIIKSPEQPLFSKNFIFKNELGIPESIQKSISLLKKRILWM